jgi:hypothetical protein
MPDPMLPLTFLNLPAEFRGVFTGPSLDSFQVLVSGFVHSLGRHGIVDAIRAAGPAAHKHYSAYYRFFIRATWSLDEFGLHLLGLLDRSILRPTVGGAYSTEIPGRIPGPSGSLWVTNQLGGADKPASSGMAEVEARMGAVECLPLNRWSWDI